MGKDGVFPTGQYLPLRVVHPRYELPRHACKYVVRQNTGTNDNFSEGQAPPAVAVQSPHRACSLVYVMLRECRASFLPALGDAQSEHSLASLVALVDVHILVYTVLLPGTTPERDPGRTATRDYNVQIHLLYDDP